MRRLIKLAAIIFGVLIAIVAGFIWYGLQTVRMFPEIEVVTESIGPGSDELAGHIDNIVSYGIRNPGTDGDAKTRSYILEKFSEYGLETKEPDTFGIKMYHPKTWRLSLNNSSNGQKSEVPCAYMPFSGSTGPQGVTAPVVYVADEESLKGLDLRGKIAAYEMKFRPKGLKTYSKILLMFTPCYPVRSTNTIWFSASTIPILTGRYRMRPA
ncbi:MAG: hypothetical protein WBM69_13445 [Desulfobacterales bacterium]